MDDSDNSGRTEQFSYLGARDPSVIISWNRYNNIVRHNLADDFERESTISNIPSEKEDNKIRIYLRVKPSANKDVYLVEDDNTTLVWKVPDASTSTRNYESIKKYAFTRIFGPETSQLDLFNQTIKPKMLDFINGHNSTLMAYGSSGSGKTFTMIGTAEQPGIIPRALEYLFRTLPAVSLRPEVKPEPNGKVTVLKQAEKDVEELNLQFILPKGSGDRVHVKTYKAMQQRLSNDPVGTVDQSPPILSVYVSFAEIYNELVYDLLEVPLRRGQQRINLKIGGVQDQIYIKGLKYIYVRSGLEAYQVLQYGINNLKYADTAVNTHSSRSHCIFTIRLVQGYDVQTSHVSMFNFCDLAGSERLKKTLNVGDRLKESTSINTSLMVLGRCLKVIRDEQCKKENKIPPFRDSKLTQLFHRALVGKENIAMIVNINSSCDMTDETQHTLTFAGVAKEVTLNVPQPKIAKPSRFSKYFKQHLSFIKEDESASEIRELRDERANLVLELSELKHEQEMFEEERERLRGRLFRIIDMKNDLIKKLEKENHELKEQQRLEKLDKILGGGDDVIEISDESDEESEEVKNLQRENKKLKCEVYISKEEQEKLRIEKNTLEKRVAELELVLEDAKSDFDDLLKEREQLKREIMDLNVKLITKEEERDQLSFDVDSLLEQSTLHVEKIEELEEQIHETRCGTPSVKLDPPD